MPRSTAFVRFLLTALVLTAMGAPRAAQAQDLKVDANWFFATDAAHAGDVVHAAVEFRFPEHFHVQSNTPIDEFLVATVLTPTVPEGVTVREIVYPKPVPFTVAGYDQPQPVFEQVFVIGLALEVRSDLPPGVYPLAASLDYQACNDKICLAPSSVAVKADLIVVASETPITSTPHPVFEKINFSDEPVAPVNPVPPPTSGTGAAPTGNADCDVVVELDGFAVLGTSGGYLSAEEFIKFIDNAETGTIERSVFEDKGPLAIVLLVIVGGVLLNLTPCVLPLVPINLAIIGAGAQAGSRSRGFALGGTYGLAMAAVYGALGLVVILTASTFGAINSTIWFNVAIAILFVFLALAMFDVIAIDFTKYQSKFDASAMGKSGTFALAFGMGAISALLAGACVAPVVIQVIVYSGDQYARGQTLALALPFFLGLGMALPWPFAGAGLSLLPKPGMWMVRVKQAMGVFILAFAAYYAYLAWGIWDNTRVDRTAVESAVAHQLEEGWTASICAGLAQAKAENKPVLIDMWATWCKNCRAMDKTTFRDEQVIARLEDYVKIKYQAQDITGPTTERDVLKRFEGIGLPHYAILRPGKPETAPVAAAER